MREQLLKNWQKTVKNRQFLSGFQPLLPRTLTHPNEIRRLKQEGNSLSDLRRMNKLNILNDPDTDICKLANWAAKGMSASLSDMGHYSFEPAYIQWVLYGRGRIPQPRYNLFSQNKHQ